MTKIPSVEERVEEFSIVNDYPVNIGGWILTYTHQLTEKQKNWLTQTLTADRLALLTELRDCELLEEKEEHQDWCKLTGELEYASCGCWKDHNTLARAIKAHLDELIKSTSV